MMFGLIFFLQS